MWGVMQTPYYRLPPMPWGIDGDEITACLHSWSSGIAAMRMLEYRVPRGWPKNNGRPSSYEPADQKPFTLPGASESGEPLTAERGH